jgi:hypothetical protein
VFFYIREGDGGRTCFFSLVEGLYTQGLEIIYLIALSGHMPVMKLSLTDADSKTPSKRLERPLQEA